MNRREFVKTTLLGGIALVRGEGIPGTATGIDYSRYKLVDGNLIMPEAPGFGMGLDF